MGNPEESTNGTGTNTVGKYSIQTNTSDGQTGTRANKKSNYSLNRGQKGTQPLRAQLARISKEKPAHLEQFSC